MRHEIPNPQDLVLTQAETAPPPHDVTVPEPPQPTPTASGESDFDPDLLLEIKGLADRVGGLEKLRDFVEALIRFQR